MLIHTTVSVHGVVFNYSDSLADMIQAGNYGRVKSEIVEIFSLNGEGKHKPDIILFRFNSKGSSISSRRVVNEMNKKNCRPAKIEGLLALGKSCPDLQREALIISLVCSSRKDRIGNIVLPYLYEDDHCRVLDTCLSSFLFDAVWRINCRFVAVHNQCLAS